MLRQVLVSYGADPEGFFRDKGTKKIVGSEKVFGSEGLGATPYGSPLVIQDGVQFELNPTSSYANTRYLGYNVSRSLVALVTHLDTYKNHIEVCWDGVVEVDREELDSLGSKARELGCQPSMNIYGPKPLTVDVATYRKRSAGGHLHFGVEGTSIFWPIKQIDERSRLIPLLDIFVGNTAVLFDRDPKAAERRENYGRAGEYRLPKYGVEYRTLSNFWLRNYTLLSLMCGMADIAIQTLVHTLDGEDLEGELVEIVNLDHFIEAINTNNFDLALKNFQTIIPFLDKHYRKDFISAMNQDTIPILLKVAQGVREVGLETYFPEDPLIHWCRQSFKSWLEFAYRMKRGVD
jgi:hypothetical protein